VLQRLRHALWPPGQRHAAKLSIIAAMNSPARTLIRPSTEADLPAIQAIYAHHVLHGTGTFETEPPSVADMATRRGDVLAKKLPWLVVELGGVVQGFAYANWFKPRAAYRFSVEDSIYMSTDSAGKGLGKLLLTELLAQLERAGVRKAMAVIGDSANAGSIGVHRACGFQDVGVVKSCGWKFGQWRDIVLMEKTLGAGDTTSPE
jgi:L-amino acid N-acyltransferase YncA